VDFRHPASETGEELGISSSVHFSRQTIGVPADRPRPHSTANFGAVTPLMALHSDTSKPTTNPVESARPLLEAMRVACSCTMLSTFPGTTSFNTERLSMIVEALKNRAYAETRSRM
jgi:hypothetical protein